MQQLSWGARCGRSSWPGEEGIPAEGRPGGPIRGWGGVLAWVHSPGNERGEGTAARRGA